MLIKGTVVDMGEIITGQITNSFIEWKTSMAYILTTNINYIYLNKKNWIFCMT